jgi:Xaa-Pro aminopeptidase
VEENAFAGLKEAIKQCELSGKLVGISFQRFPASFTFPLQNIVELQDIAGILTEITLVKDKFAQDEIRKRVRYLDIAFSVAADVIQPGVTEMDVFVAIYTSIAKSLGHPFILDCTIASGKRTLEDEPQPTNKVIEAGENILIDLFPVMGGYGADYTRNFVAGKATDKQKQQHAVLENALFAAEKVLRPGVQALEVDRTVRNVIEEAGYGEFAHQHHSGHAFGLSIPEELRIIPGESRPILEGMVIAVEPGIYHPRNGGMRLEGNYIISSDGCDSLARFPTRLIECLH